MSSFSAFFKQATGQTPYPYQRRLAEAPTLPAHLTVPTGLGKTAAIILAWAWRRAFARSLPTPKRLVYCLPMRVLVGQTLSVARDWFERLGLSKLQIHSLMGGELDDDWTLSPEREALLVGTQDMLLSRALNRGFAMSRYQWPAGLAWLNDDCWWVQDEVQLMGTGLATTAQLQALRRKLETFNPTRSTWMSATPVEDFAAPDFDAEQDGAGRVDLDDDDRTFEAVSRRLQARKTIAGLALSDDKATAKQIRERHQPGTLSLVVVNQVKRAQSLFLELKKQKAAPRLVLIHSRFRGQERARHLRALLEAPTGEGTIAVSTQVVEAGVDVSARTLFTELAPASSLIQRFGRLNRAGEWPEAHAFWMVPAALDDKWAKPYDLDSLKAAQDWLGTLTDVGPAALALCPPPKTPYQPAFVLRRKDLVELFDTTPDLAGADLDVTRFIRDQEDHDVQVFFRDFTDEPPADLASPRPDELCPVPVGDFGKRKGFAFDALAERWLPAPPIPGRVLLVHPDEGGYDPELGWMDKAKAPKLSLVLPPVAGPAAEANDTDRLSQKPWLTLAAHTDDVVKTLKPLLALVPETLHAPLVLAARWHDAGKAHPVFQAALPEARPGVWAKAPGAWKRYTRKGFRHELASALALAIHHPEETLAAYLVAAHHGKVRMSLRALPHEKAPAQGHQARGVVDGDCLPACDLGGGVALPPTALDLSLMEMGEGPHGPSWLARALKLRNALGPFRLSLLESLLRVADCRASAEENRP